MSKVLIKTMMSELGSIIPQNELDKIADKIAEVIDLKSRASRSNIDPLAKSERIKSTILQLGNIKEEIIEKLYDHGVEEPDKIRSLAKKTMQKIDKAMESKYVSRLAARAEGSIKDEVRSEERHSVPEDNPVGVSEPIIVQDPTTPKQGEPSVPKEDKDKVDDGGNNIISNIPENKPALQQVPNKAQILSFIDSKFKIALNERPNEIQNIYRKYKEDHEIDSNESQSGGVEDAYPLEFKKSIIKANKIFNNIDEYFDIPEEVPTPTFEEIFNAVEQTKEKRKLEKLINISEIIEDNRREKEKRSFELREAEAKTESMKGDLPEELPPPRTSFTAQSASPKRIGKLKFK